MSTANSDRWMLPEGMFEALPGQAQALETLRRELLDLFASWGYQYCMPPIVEHLDALLTGVGSTLERETFKLTDPSGGRLLGIRADMTTQAARIDANRLHGQGINRLCYVGSVLRNAPSNAHQPRNPTQVGAELFGVDNVKADHEMLRLMVATLQQAGVENLHVDIGHIGVYRAIIKGMGWTVEQAKPLYRLLQGRCVPELQAFVQQAGLDADWQKIICALPALHGDLEVLAEAKNLLADKAPDAIIAIDEIQAAASLLTSNKAIKLHIDLIELRGYSYHTGLVFSALVPGVGRELARGGRYNSVGAAFGQARAATGFSADLGAVFEATSRKVVALKAVLAPADSNDKSLQAAIAELRSQGVSVIEDVSDNADAAALHCNRRLQYIDGSWQLTAV